jgi:hypothetical protein
MHEHGAVGSDGRCLVHRRTIEEVEQALRAEGVDRTVIGAWAREQLDSESGVTIGF